LAPVSAGTARQKNGVLAASVKGMSDRWPGEG
jgi:hypothetical protein